MDVVVTFMITRRPCLLSLIEWSIGTQWMPLWNKVTNMKHLVTRQGWFQGFIEWFLETMLDILIPVMKGSCF